jgi:hypothetical protein
MDKDFLTELIKKNWPMAVFLVIFWLVYQDFTHTNQMLITEMIANNRATVEKLDKSIDRLSEALNRLEARQAAVEIKIDSFSNPQSSFIAPDSIRHLRCDTGERK